MKFLDSFQGWTLTLLRIVTAFLFWQHGLQKLFGVLEREAVQFPQLLWFAGVLEFFWTDLCWLWAVYSSSRLSPVRRDGICLLYQPLSQRLLARTEPRGTSHSVLFHLPLAGNCWSWKAGSG